MSLRQLFRNSTYLFIGGVGVAVVSFVQGIIVTRTLGTSLYGMLAVVMTFSGLIKAFLSFRTYEPLTRYLVEKNPC